MPLEGQSTMSNWPTRSASVIRANSVAAVRCAGGFVECVDEVEADVPTVVLAVVPGTVPEPEPDESTSAEAGAFDSIGRKSMLELIEDLSPEQQQVLTLKFVFNFANAEAATILGKTEGAIKSLQHRALASLQKQLEKREQS